MAKISKRMQEAYKGVDSEKFYNLSEAVQLIKSKAKAKFDETIDITFKLNIDTRKSEQNIRGAMVLPNGTGKTLRVAVFAKDAKAEEAKKAGADLVGAEDLAEIIKGGNLNFDRCIATPEMMALVGTLGKVLGPRGLMPNPKLGTVTLDVADAVQAAKGSQIEYRAEKAGIIHAGVGKASFSEKNLEENIKALAGVVIKAKPDGIKGSYLLKVTLSSSMGPSVKLSVADLV